MTNKTINGVPRGFLETAVKLCYLLGTPPDSPLAKELRALLAAPDPDVEADGIGEPVAVIASGYSGAPDGRNAKCIKELDLTNCSIGTKLYSADQLAALQSTIAQLKAENERFRDGAVAFTGYPPVPDDRKIDPPASVAVKLPDLKPEPTTAEIIDPDCNHSTGYVDGRNACLDEVRRMNGEQG